MCYIQGGWGAQAVEELEANVKENWPASLANKQPGGSE